MKDGVKILVAVLLSFLLSAFLFSKCDRKEEVKVVEVHDTIVKIEKEPIFVDRPTFSVERIVDTIYIPKVDTTAENGATNGYPLIITQRFYESENYKAWVSGYNPSLDSIITFNTTEYKYITKTITEKVYPKSWSLYGKLNLYGYGKDICPTISLQVNTPDRFSFEAGVGYMNGNMAYNFGIGYKILGK